MKTWLRSWIRVSILQKGLSGNSKFWFYVGVGGIVRRLYRRFAQKEEHVVFGEKLLPGQRYQLYYKGPPSRKVRKQNAER